MEPFIGEIRAIAFNWAPQGWFFCNGQTLQIAQYQALFALIGTTYGGNGSSTFMLPNLQGRVVAGLATNQSTCPPGVTFARYSAIAGNGGAESGNGTPGAVTLAAANLPGHTHPATFTPTGSAPTPVGVTIGVADGAASQASPKNGVLATAATNARPSTPVNTYAAAATAGATLAGVTVTGGGGITGGTVGVQSNNTGTPTPVALPGATVPVLQPYQVLNYIIAWQGIFPSRP